MTNELYHTPVLLRESVNGLVDDINGIYVDATLGGGGHTREVLSRLGTSGVLFGFDQDRDAAANVPEDVRFRFVMSNFRHLKNQLRFAGISMVQGVLADLGVSSHQFDVAERGFSIRSEARLDMRMDRSSALTAANVINDYSEEALSHIFYAYGELRESRQIAAAIVKARSARKVATTGELIALSLPVSRDPKQSRFLAKLFQALRIEVNDEIGALKALLSQCAEVIRPGGALVVISYHSLEDRLVKHFMRSGNFEGVLQKDFYGNPLRPFTPMQGMPVVPGEDEIAINTRARSAKLRIAIKNE